MIQDELSMIDRADIFSVPEEVLDRSAPLVEGIA